MSRPRTSRALLIPLALLLSVSTGCGTIFNAVRFPYENNVYGGVVVDAVVVSEGGGLMVLGLLDFPFSFVADTLLLIYTVPKALLNLPPSEVQIVEDHGEHGSEGRADGD